MRHFGLRLVPLLALMGFVSACAAKRVPAVARAEPPAPLLVDVRPLIDRGCYRCLEEAFATAESQQQPDLAFEAAALLTLRSKELGMPWAAWQDKAAMLAATDATRMQLMEMVTAIRPDVLAGHREATSANPQETMRIRKLVPAWRDALENGAGSASLRAYLLTSLVCAYQTNDTREAALDLLAERGPDIPLLRYRHGACRPQRTPELQDLLAADPGYVDASYPIGRSLRDTNQEDAMRHLQAAVAAFPTSASAHVAIGDLFQAWEDWPSALSAFDASLTLIPLHPDGLIGRAIALSHLNRHQESIDAATRLIENGSWFLGLAHYWRGWGHLQLKNNEAARADADRTLTLMINPMAYQLSGLVEWSMLRRENAEKEFERAVAMDFGHCDSAFFLGGVRAEMRKAQEGIAAFEQAVRCFELATSVRQRLIDGIRGGAGSEAGKARQVAAQQRAIDANGVRIEQARRVIGDLQRLQSSLKVPPSQQGQKPSRQGQQ
jgi:tetratricopeptide (TPR) repeat protein